MTGSLRWHGAPVELAGQAERELADIDHLLDLAEGLRADLADLDHDQVGDVSLVLLQELAQSSHERPANGGGNGAPGQEGLMRPGDGAYHVLGRGDGQLRDGPRGDRRAGSQVATGRNMGPAGGQGGLGNGRQVGRHGGSLPCRTRLRDRISALRCAVRIR